MKIEERCLWKSCATALLDSLLSNLVLPSDDAGLARARMIGLTIQDTMDESKITVEIIEDRRRTAWE